MLINQLIFCYAFQLQCFVKRFVRDHVATPNIPYHAQFIDYDQYIEYNIEKHE